MMAVRKNGKDKGLESEVKNPLLFGAKNQLRVIRETPKNQSTTQNFNSTTALSLLSTTPSIGAG